MVGIPLTYPVPWWEVYLAGREVYLAGREVYLGGIPGYIEGCT